MKFAARTIISALLLSLLVPVSPVFAQGTITQGEWTVNYPDFSKFATDSKWRFELRANGTNEFGSGDYVSASLETAGGTDLAYGMASQTSGSSKSLTIDLTLYKRDIARDVSNSSFILILDVSRAYGSKFKDADLKFTIPKTTMPTRPRSTTDYVKLITDFTTAIPFPTECTGIPVAYEITDPYSDIQVLNIDIMDSTGNSLAGTLKFGGESGRFDSKLQVCPYELEDGKSPYQLQFELEFVSGLSKAPEFIKIPITISRQFASVEETINQMPNVCQKGSSFKTAKGSCPSGYKAVNFTKPTTTQWNSLSRTPNSQKGKNFIVYGCVAQFDANTGGSKFRGYVLPDPAKSYYSGVNSLLTGNAKSLLKLSEKDAFAAKVYVSGATTYTSIGGRNAVPNLAIRDFVKIGTC